MNKIREQLAEPFGGLRKETLDELESVVRENCILFSRFCAENFIFNNTCWTRFGVDYTIEELFKIWQNEK